MFDEAESSSDVQGTLDYRVQGLAPGPWTLDLVTMVEKVVTLVVDFFVALLYNVCDGLVTCG